MQFLCHEEMRTGRTPQLQREAAYKPRAVRIGYLKWHG